MDSETTVYKTLTELQSEQSKLFESIVKSSLPAVFGPVSPIAGFITYLAIEAGVNHALEKSGRVTKSLLRRPFEKLATAFKNSLSEDSRLRKFLDRLEKIGEELGNNPDELKKRVNEEMLKFLEELKQREEAKKRANEEIREAIRYLLSEEISEDVKRLEELFETSGYFAYEYYSILLGILTDRKCREILEKMGGIERTGEETLDWVKAVAGDLNDLSGKLEEVGRKVDKYFEELNDYLDRNILLSHEFEILSLKDLTFSTPDKNKWSEILRLQEVYANYDAPRSITPEIEAALEDGRSCVLYGEPSYGKSVLLKRVAIDMLNKGYVVAYSERADPKAIKIIEKIGKRRGEKVIVVVDDVHRCLDVLSAAYNCDGVTFLFAARPGELEKAQRKNFEATTYLLLNKLNAFKLGKLTEEEIRLFVEKYAELLGEPKFTLDEYTELSKGDPLVLNLLLTEGAVMDAYLEELISLLDRDSVKKYTALISSLIHLSGLNHYVISENPNVFLFDILCRLGILKRTTEGEEKLRDAVDSLRGKFIAESSGIYITRHEVLAGHFMEKCFSKDLFYEGFRNVAYDKLAEIVAAIIDYISDLDKDLAKAAYIEILDRFEDYNMLVKLADLTSKFDDPGVYLAYANSLSNCYDARAWDRAEKAYIKALNIVKKSPGDYSSLHTGILNCLGELYHKLGDFEKSERCYVEALKICENRTDLLFEHGMVLNNLGTLYIDMKKYDDAEDVLKRAFEKFRELFRKDGAYLVDLCGVETNIGNLHLETEDFKRAEEAFARAWYALTDYGNECDDFAYLMKLDRTQIAVLDSLGRLYMETNRLF